jgi:hypothetical protein
MKIKSIIIFLSLASSLCAMQNEKPIYRKLGHALISLSVKAELTKRFITSANVQQISSSVNFEEKYRKQLALISEIAMPINTIENYWQLNFF